MGVTTAAAFRAPQVCTLTGITYRQLDYWDRTELVVPSVTEARGPGTVRRWSFDDLVRLSLVCRLLEAGVSLQSARRGLAALDGLDDGAFVDGGVLVVDGTRATVVFDGDELLALLRSGGGVLVVLPLGRVVADMRAAVAA